MRRLDVGVHMIVNSENEVWNDLNLRNLTVV
jgi:hypothetical protein